MTGGPVWDDGGMAGELVRVLTTPSILEGEVARSRLESEGIPVLLKGEGEGPYRLGPVHLFVPAELEVQARLILSGGMGLVGDEEPEERPEERSGPAG